VVDAYARRILERLGWMRGDEGDSELRTRFMNALPACPDLFNEYHALIVRHGKERCRKVPICDDCPLADLCAAHEKEKP
jgi:endonuclease-3 related protein